MFKNLSIIALLATAISSYAGICIPEGSQGGYLELASKAGRCSIVRIAPKNTQNIKLFSFRVSENKAGEPEFSMLGQTMLTCPTNVKYDWAGTGTTTYRMYTAVRNDTGFQLVPWQDVITVQPVATDKLCFTQFGTSYKPLNMSVDFTGLYIGVGALAILAAAGVGGYMYHRHVKNQLHSGLDSSVEGGVGAIKGLKEEVTNLKKERDDAQQLNMGQQLQELREHLKGGIYIKTLQGVVNDYKIASTNPNEIAALQAADVRSSLNAAKNSIAKSKAVGTGQIISLIDDLLRLPDEQIQHDLQTVLNQQPY